MTNLQIKEYIYSLGKTAAELHDIELALYKMDENDSERRLEQITRLVTLVKDSDDAQNLIVQLANDAHTDIRQVAAALVNYLWCYWKYIPYDSNNRRAYNKAMKARANELSWTIPLIEKFIFDRTKWPVVISLYNIWEMEYAERQEIDRLRSAVLVIADNATTDVKKAIVRTLTSYYEDNDEVRHLLDDRALQFYINATYDSDEQVRDWALFELWTDVENVNDSVAEAFIAAFERESPQSEAYVEAVVGMARMGLQYEKLTPIVLDNLARDDCGTGWIDAAEQMHTEDSLLSLVDLYNRIVEIDNEDTSLNRLEDTFEFWND